MDIFYFTVIFNYMIESEYLSLFYIFMILSALIVIIAGACPGIRKRGGPKSESLFFFFFFFCFSIFQGGGPAQKLAEKMTISSKKVAKYR